MSLACAKRHPSMCIVLLLSLSILLLLGGLSFEDEAMGCKSPPARDRHTMVGQVAIFVYS